MSGVAAILKFEIDFDSIAEEIQDNKSQASEDESDDYQDF